MVRAKPNPVANAIPMVYVYNGGNPYDHYELYKLSKTSIDNYWTENNKIIKYRFSLHLFQYTSGKFYDYNQRKWKCTWKSNDDGKR